MRALGSGVQNGKKYIELLAAIAGYFVLSCQAIPRKRALLYASLFFAGGVTPALADLIYFAGPNSYSVCTTCFHPSRPGRWPVRSL